LQTRANCIKLNGSSRASFGRLYFGVA